MRLRAPSLQRWLWFVGLYLAGVTTLLVGSWLLKHLLLALR